MCKLTVELVPKTAWYSNVRSNVPKSQWDIIRRAVYKKAGYMCEVGGGKGTKHPVECHEVWEYNDDTKIQKLTRMIALCPACHNVKHLGRARAIGLFEVAIGQLMKVNEWSRAEAIAYTKKVFEQWQERSKIKWKLDLKELNKYGNEKREGTW